jgi:hypothetical protein
MVTFAPPKPTAAAERPSFAGAANAGIGISIFGFGQSDRFRDICGNFRCSPRAAVRRTARLRICAKGEIAGSARYEKAANRGGRRMTGVQSGPSDAGPLCNTGNQRPYRRPLQVWRYLRQFPSPRSPNSSLLRQACLNSAHTSLRTGLWQVSRYLRQFPSPRSPSASLFSQARRNCSHCPPPTRTPPGPISMDWAKAEIGNTKRAAAAAAPNAYLRIAFNIL